MKYNFKLIMIVLLMGFMVTAASFAYWTWYSPVNKNIVFNTAAGLSDYVIYDEGESKFVGDFQVGSSYLDGIHSTIAISKSDKAINTELYATVNMTIDEIGEVMKVSNALKWTITTGDSDEENPVILNSGTFYGKNKDDVVRLYSPIVLTTDIQKFTVWLWLDEAENPSEELTGETVDVRIWTQIDQALSGEFSVAELSASYQVINATVVNSSADIVSYAVTRSNVEPTEWVNVDSSDVSNLYKFNYVAEELGVYYVWFKDSNGETVSRSVTVSEIDTNVNSVTIKAIKKDTNIAVVSDTWSNKGLNFIFETSGLEDIEIHYCVDESNICEPSSDTGVTKPNLLVTDYNQEEGTYYVRYKVVTLSGDESEVLSYKAKVDFSGVTGEFDIELNNNIANIELTISPGVSGVTGNYYYKVSKNKECSSLVTDFTESTTTTYTYEIPSDGEYFVCVKVMDNAGSEFYLRDSFMFVTPPTISFENGIVQDGLVFNFDGRNNTGNGHSDSAGTWKNLNGTVVDGTLVGSTWQENGLSFNGTSDAVLLEQMSFYESTSATFQIHVRASSVNSSNNVGLLGNWHGSSGGGLYFNENVIPTFSFYGFLVIGPAINILEDYLLTGVYDGSSIYIYVNDYMVGSRVIDGSLIDSDIDAIMAIGCDPSSSSCEDDYFNGIVYSARIYNRALSEDEIKQNYHVAKAHVSDWVSDDVKFNLTGNTLGENGLSHYEYSINNGNKWNNYLNSSVVSSDTPVTLQASVVGDEGTKSESSSVLVNIDKNLPSGSVSLNFENDIVSATVSASDSLSGIRNRYGWKISMNNTCDSSVTGFTDTETLTYSFTNYQIGTNYVCVRIQDNAGNVNYISGSIYVNSTLYSYTGDYQLFTTPMDGYYKIEAWGAQGGSNDGTGGNGGYLSGNIYLNADEKLYIYVGELGKISNDANVVINGGYNGGGSTNSVLVDSLEGGSGGGATDIRYFGNITPSTSDLVWNSTLGLNSRIMVAAGGGGVTDATSGALGGIGGGLLGSDGIAHEYVAEKGDYIGYKALQSSGGNIGTAATSGTAGTFGIGGTSGVGPGDVNHPGSGGGGGYYGGGGSAWHAGAGGGSSFISGYSGVNAITSSTDRTHTNNTNHYSGKYFVDGEMQSGVNSGNGKAKITYIGDSYSRKNTVLDNVRYIRDCVNGNSLNASNNWIEIQAIYQGNSVSKNSSITNTYGVVQNTYGTGDLNTIVDGVVDQKNQYVWSNYNYDCVTIDLGNTYNLDEVAVWHYYADGRTYNDNVTYVSSDNSNWKMAINKQEAETSQGKRFDAWDNAPGSYVSYSYDNNGGSGCSDNYSAVIGGTYGSLCQPTRAGYDFAGWYDSDNVKVTSSSTVSKTSTHTLTASWTAKTYTINYYVGNKSSGVTSVGSSTCRYKESCTLTTFADLGAIFPYSAADTSVTNNGKFSFWGWTTNMTTTTPGTREHADGASFTYNTVGDKNLYALGRRSYGFVSGISPTTYVSSGYQYWNPYSTNDAYLTGGTIPEPTAITGWTFVGYVANNVASSSVTYNSSQFGTQIKFPLNSYLAFRSVYSREVGLKYNANGGSGTMANSTTTQYYNSGYPSSGSNTVANVSTPSFTLKANGFTRSGYVFSKWADGSTSGTQYAAGATYTSFVPAVDSTTTVRDMYAIWNVNKVTVTLNGGISETISYSGTASGSVTLGTNGKGTVSLTPGTYTFTGGLSGHSTGSVSITAAKTVNVYPAGALFWYGNGDTSGDSLYNSGNTFAADNYVYPSGASRNKLATVTVTAGTNAITIKMKYNSSDGYAKVVTGTATFQRSVNLSGYTKININSSGSGTIYAATAKTTGFSSNGSMSASSGGSMNIAPYIAVFNSGYSNSLSWTTTINAVWLT